MKKLTNKEIKDLNNETVDAIVEDRDKSAALKVMAQTDGGKLLIESLSKDVLHSVDRIASGAQDMTHIQLVSEAASLRQRILLLRTLTRAEDSEKLLSEELENALTEVLQQ